MNKISIITPTFNCRSNLLILFETLKNQTCFNFEWIIADGESFDSTLDIFNGVTTPFDLKISIKKDFGIYDAINRGISISTCNHYLIVGSDDQLFSNAVHDIIIAINKYNSYDFFCFSLYVGNKLFHPRKRPVWLYGMSGISSCHSVGLVITKKLHESLGYYSNKFPLASDQLFVLEAFNLGSKFIRFPNIITGKYSYYGLSSTDFIGTLSECYRIKIRLYPHQRFVQTVLYILRILKNFNKVR
jgi:glycosyltransferase involved in cell wall biosynthesis